MQDGIRTLTETDLNTLTTTKQSQYGAIGVTEDGRRFRYVSFGGTSTIAPGLIVTAAALTANFQAMAITASGTGGQVAANYAGSQSGFGLLVLTNSSSTAITADQFAEGFLDIIVGGASADTGHYTYRIRGNTAAGAGNVTATYCTVYLAESFRHTTALVPGTDTANLRISDYSTVNTSTTAALPIGLTINPVPNTATVTNYGWVQVGGDCVVLNDAGGTITVGGAFGQSVSTAGNVVAATASTHPIIGYTKIAISASTSAPAWLSLA
jgi:hypothetical protein